MTNVLSIADLPRYDVDPVRGFLPPNDPLTALPPAFAAWDAIAARVPELLAAKGLRAEIDRMPVLDASTLSGPAERARAMLILTIFANGYVWESTPPATRLPPPLGKPLSWLATALDRPPIAAHASLVLANYRRRDPSKGLVLGNIDTLLTFGGIEDESWFYLVTVEIEATGAGAIPDFLAAGAAVAANDATALTGILERIGKSIAQVTAVFERMYERCRPEQFFRNVRPWLAGWPDGVIYEGGSPEPVRLAGGSAAQSALIQAYDATLGVTHPSPVSGPFLLEMRKYMLPGHRRFLEALDRAPSVARFVAERGGNEPALVAAYNGALEELDRFRKSHLTVAGRYITAEAKGNPDEKGTGGTDYGAFLGAARRETQDAKRPS